MATNQVQEVVLRRWTDFQNIPSVSSLREKYRALSPLLQKIALVLGLLINLLILLGLLYVFFGTVVVIGFIASILAGLATGLGALPALFFKEVSNRTYNTMLGGAAGVMLAATAFSLIVPGIEHGNQLWPGKGFIAVAIGMIIGAVFLDLADRRLPRIHFLLGAEDSSQSLRKVWLFIFAITIHNFPEGMAVGVSFGTGDIKNGIVLAMAIGLQNIPEGLAVALPLVALGYDRRKAVLIGTLTGLVEPIGGLLGVAAVTLFHPLLPIGMGFAAGAMLFVISEEIIPETQSNGKARYATFAVLFGFIIMMGLDSVIAR